MDTTPRSAGGRCLKANGTHLCYSLDPAVPEAVRTMSASLVTAA